jgi:cytochrome b6-f complex iron-sulfur subunit
MSEPDDRADESRPQAKPSEEVDRRDFFSEVAGGALALAGIGAAVVTYQFLSPNVLFEPSPTFRAGNPEAYAPESVTYREQEQVYIVRTKEGGFYAVSAVCTHLGCVTQWKEDAKQIQCPCHGSKFEPSGKKVEGPAPRPLPHFAITLTPDGELLVDKLQIVKSDQILKV